MLNVAESVTELALRDRSVRRDKSNRASSLGHPCARHLVLRRTDGEKADLPSPSLAGLFGTGNVLEPVIERILSSAGQAADPRWRIVGSQKELVSTVLTDHQISGHIDGVIQTQEGDIWKDYGVCDIKTSNPNVFNNLSDVESLEKYFWTQRYIAQLTVYALGTEQKRCVLIFINKANLFEIKIIEWELDMKIAEELLAKARLINDHIRGGTLPDKLNRPDICGRCEMAHVCLPELKGTTGLKIISDVDLADMLDRRDLLEAAKKEFDAIERKLKAQLVGGTDVVCGNHMITWKEVSKKAYSVAATTYFQKKIINLGNTDDAD